MSKEMASFLKISELTKSITSLDAAGGGEKKKKPEIHTRGFIPLPKPKRQGIHIQTFRTGGRLAPRSLITAGTMWLLLSHLNYSG